MAALNFVFLGIKGSAIALDKATGAQIWATRLKGGEFVNLVLSDLQRLLTQPLGRWQRSYPQRVRPYRVAWLEAKLRTLQQSLPPRDHSQHAPCLD